MDYLTFKLISIALIILAGQLGGLIPLRAARVTSDSRLFSLGAAFSGGIFIGAGLIHMLPDANEGFTSSFEGIEYPIAFLICALGFLLILLLDRVALGKRGDHAQQQSAGGRPGTSFILALILSVHSVIAGIALGVDGSVTTSAVILVAILSHKGSAAFALAVNMVKSGVPKNEARKTLNIFTVMTPTGVVIGLILHHLLLADNQVVLEAVFDAVAAGTFLYIAILEVIGEEFEVPTGLVPKFFCLTAGLGLMSMLALWL